jgi:hypothetical protein
MGGFTRLRNEDFRQEHAVVEGFMRSVVVPEHDDPLRMAKHFFRQRLFSGAEIPVASVAVENEDVAVFAEDLDRLAGVGALVEQVAAWLRIVGN